MGKAKKILTIFFSSIFILFTLITLYGAYGPEWGRYLEKRREAKLHAELEKNLREEELAYRNDFDGGKTPEETLDLFLSALTSRDIEKASKYYQLPIQEKALQSLKDEEKKEGNLEKSIKYFRDLREKGKKECRDIEKSYGGCTFEYQYITTESNLSSIFGTNDKILIPTGSKRTKAVDLNLNLYTDIWKITQPY